MSDGAIHLVLVTVPTPAPHTSARAAERRGWRRVSAPGDKLRARWTYNETGWEVRHCGHPTANWPYHAIDPAQPERCVMTHNGLGFRGLFAAMQAVEAITVGAWMATNLNCGPTTRRVLTPADAVRYGISFLGGSR